MDKEEFILYWTEKLKPWAELQLKLSNISSIDEEMKKDISKIIPPIFYSTKKSLIILLQLTQGFLINEENNLDFYFSILEFLIPKIKEFLTSYEIFSIYHKTFNHILLWYYDHQLLDIETIIEVSKNDCDLFEYFIYDIKEHDEKIYEILNKRFDTQIHYHPLKNFKENREARINETPIAKAIRKDEIDEFQNIISLTNMNINSKIEFSLFESCSAVNYSGSMPSLLEYASFFGSIKIFKYLLLQNAEITSNIWEYAIHGNNYDIIHLIEGKHIPPHDCIINAIRYYRYDLFDYFIESQDIEITKNCINRAILNFNLTVLIDERFLSILYDDPNFSQEIDIEWTPLICSALKSYPIITEMLLSIQNINPNIYYRFESSTPIIISARNYCFENVKLLYEHPETNVNTLIGTDIYFVSAQIGDTRIINYILSNNHNIHDNIQSFDNDFITKKYKELNFEVFFNCLVISIQNIHLNAFKLFYNDPLFVQKENSFFYIIFMMAIQNEFWDCVKFIIHSQPDETFDAFMEKIMNLIPEKSTDSVEIIKKIFDDEKMNRKKD
ncbi:hypothetical protein M9Y10_011656 [Tritrichomonas musculus]|uniref:DUF3447 domain-containing protein n=1 Tax=Tritrichomonas musculus TaxID=1915356 RepID=A0ABR2IK08_9EUKA